MWIFIVICIISCRVWSSIYSQTYWYFYRKHGQQKLRVASCSGFASKWTLSQTWIYVWDFLTPEISTITSIFLFLWTFKKLNFWGKKKSVFKGNKFQKCSNHPFSPCKLTYSCLPSQSMLSCPRSTGSSGPSISFTAIFSGALVQVIIPSPVSSTFPLALPFF